MLARIAGLTVGSNQTLQFPSAQADELSSQISSLGVVQSKWGRFPGGFDAAV